MPWAQVKRAASLVKAGGVAIIPCPRPAVCQLILHSLTATTCSLRLAGMKGLSRVYDI